MNYIELQNHWIKDECIVYITFDWEVNQIKVYLYGGLEVVVDYPSILDMQADYQKLSLHIPTHKI
jgi:hypothetical protein